jgi:putative ABC transport system permease protein
MDLPGGQAAFRRSGAVSSVRVRVRAPRAADAVAGHIAADPRLQATLMPETQFYQERSRERTRLIEAFAYLVTGIMAAGAIIAAYSTMHAAVSVRAVEIATLRALGFRSAPIVASVLLEAWLLSVFGGLLGGGLVYALYDGYATSTLDDTSLSQVAFEFAVTPELVASGLTWAMLLGLAGGLIPAVGAARAGIAQALKGE